MSHTFISLSTEKDVSFLCSTLIWLLQNVVVSVSDLKYFWLLNYFTTISGAAGRAYGKYATVETEELRCPLKMGWKREITVREYSKSGIRGDVLYYAPCGKKFKQYPDIMRVSLSIENKTDNKFRDFRSPSSIYENLKNPIDQIKNIKNYKRTKKLNF